MQKMCNNEPHDGGGGEGDMICMDFKKLQRADSHSQHPTTILSKFVAIEMDRALHLNCFVATQKQKKNKKCNNNTTNREFL